MEEANIDFRLSLTTAPAVNHWKKISCLFHFTHLCVEPCARADTVQIPLCFINENKMKSFPIAASVVRKKKNETLKRTFYLIYLSSKILLFFHICLCYFFVL